MYCIKLIKISGSQALYLFTQKLQQVIYKNKFKTIAWVQGSQYSNINK